MKNLILLVVLTLSGSLAMAQLGNDEAKLQSLTSIFTQLQGSTVVRITQLGCMGFINDSHILTSGQCQATISNGTQVQNVTLNGEEAAQAIEKLSKIRAPKVSLIDGTLTLVINSLSCSVYNADGQDSTTCAMN